MSFENPTFESRELEPKAKIEVEPDLDDFVSNEFR